MTPERELWELIAKKIEELRLRATNLHDGPPQEYMRGVADGFETIASELEKLLAAAPAPTPAPPTQYSPKGNFCSICRVDNQWCEHIQPPAEPVVPERSVAMRVAEQLMAQNMLDVPCVTALPVIERALRVVPEREPRNTNAMGEQSIDPNGSRRSQVEEGGKT